MKMVGGVRLALCALGAAIALGSVTFAGAAMVRQPGAREPAAPQSGATRPAKPLLALARLEPGQWQIREYGQSQGPVQSICLTDPEMLVQIEHRQTTCSRFVIDNDANSATVHYTCPANGYGRTAIRVETAQLAKIDTQGLIGKVPFAYRAEARRTGPCERSAAVAR
jgi:hypothetical protein